MKIFLCYECKNNDPCICKLPEPVICEDYPNGCIFMSMSEKAEWVEAREVKP